MGLCAYFNGFYREAVLDFAASLKRFYENCINIFLIEHYLNQNAYGEKYQYTIPGEGGVFYDYRTVGDAFSLFKNYLGKETRWYQKVGAILSVGSSFISTYNSIFGEPQYEEWIVY